jgi:hypothetical protein
VTLRDNARLERKGVSRAQPVPGPAHEFGALPARPQHDLVRAASALEIDSKRPRAVADRRSRQDTCSSDLNAQAAEPVCVGLDRSSLDDGGCAGPRDDLPDREPELRCWSGERVRDEKPDDAYGDKSDRDVADNAARLGLPACGAAAWDRVDVLQLPLLPDQGVSRIEW